MGILTRILLGATSGWLASIVTKRNSEMGALANITVGIIGSFIGSFLVKLTGGYGVNGFNIYSIAISVLGSVVLISVFGLYKKKH